MLWIGAAVVVVMVVAAAVLDGVKKSGRREGETAARRTNLAPTILPAAAASLLAVPPGVASPAVAAGPRIVFATPVYDFGQIKGGETVNYSYVFTNVGSAILHVSNVHASCGCTTTGEWSRQVEPGHTGRIPVLFNSQNFSGAVGKIITVTCNDPNQPAVVLQIKGTIWRPIDVVPAYAMLKVTIAAPSNATTVRIVNNEAAPLTLSAPESSNPAFAVELSTNQPGKEFHLTVRTVPPLPAGSVQGQITLKTSSTNMPVINIGAWVIMQQAVVATPSQILLPEAPLANSLVSTVSIQNNGTNALALTEPAMNVKGVDLQLRELQPGRSFTLTVSFPAGFAILPGEKVELSVKSDHPQFPIIKVPVIQPSHPASPGGSPITLAVPPSSSQ